MVGYMYWVAFCSVGHIELEGPCGGLGTGPDVFMPVCQRVDAVLLDPALGIEWGKCCLVQMHPKDLVPLALEPVHPVLERSLTEKGLLVVMMADLFLCDNLGGALCFLFVAALE